MLLGMLQWMVTIDRPELCQLVAFLNYFGECSRERNLDLVVQAFGYIKTILNKKIAINFRLMKLNKSIPKFKK